MKSGTLVHLADSMSPDPCDYYPVRQLKDYAVLVTMITEIILRKLCCGWLE